MIKISKNRIEAITKLVTRLLHQGSGYSCSRHYLTTIHSIFINTKIMCIQNYKSTEIIAIVTFTVAFFPMIDNKRQEILLSKTLKSKTMVSESKPNWCFTQQIETGEEESILSLPMVDFDLCAEEKKP